MLLAHPYTQAVLSRWRLVVGLVVGCTLAAWLVTVLILAQKPDFTAAARLNIVPTSEELGYASRFVRGSTFDGGAVLLQTYAEFAHTRPVVEPIVDRYIDEHARAAGQSRAAWIAANTGPPGFSPGRIISILNYGEAPPKPLRDDIVEELIEKTTLETVEGTYLLRVAVEWDDPESAAWFANALSQAIIARAERMSRKTGSELAGTLEERLDEKRAALAAALNQSRTLKSQAGVVDIDRQKQSLIEARLTEQAQLTNDRANLDSSEGQVAGLRRQANGRLSPAQQVLEQTLAVEAPRASGLKRSVAIREGRIAQLGAQLAELANKELRIKAVDDQVTALQAEVVALTERVSFSQTENLANGPRIQLIERAEPPTVRSSPKTLLNTALGFIAGCALAAMALLLLGPAPPRRVEEFDAPVEDAVEEPAEDTVVPLRRAPEAPRAAPRTIGSAALDVDAPMHAPRAESAAILPMTPRADPAPSPFDLPAGHLFPVTLPRPADGMAYPADALPASARRVAQWLAEPMAPDGRPLFVAALEDEGDAQIVYRLLLDQLREAGWRVQMLDATDGKAPLIAARASGKPLIYGGGLGESGQGGVIAALPADAHLVLVARATDPDAARAAVGQWSHATGIRFVAPPHVVALHP